MSDLEQPVPGDKISYTQHDLYATALQKMADGDDAGAVEALESLSKLYPGDRELQSLLLREQLRTAFGTSDYIPADHAPARPMLRNLVVVLLIVTVLLVVVAGLTALYRQVYLPRVEAQEQEAYIQSLWDEARALVDAGSYVQARQALEELQTLVPNHEEIQKLLDLIEQLQRWDDLYADCVDASNRGEHQQALDLCGQIPQDSPKYPEAQEILIPKLQEKLALESDWSEAEALIDAGDYEGAIDLLDQIRSENPEFRKNEVEQRLFELHRLLAFDLLDRARGNADLLREAVGHLDAALALRPANQDLVEERDLAEAYVRGDDAYNRGDWPSAAASWETVYAVRPDYQDGALRRRLEQVYPRAAEEQIAGACGSARQLRLALGNLARALEFDPGNEALLQERDLINQYLEGLDAFNDERWDLAIYSWGPLHDTNPGYQCGVLEENLRTACASSESPDEAYCSP